MGLIMSAMAGGSMYSQMINFVTDTMYTFVQDSENEEQFQAAILRIFKSLNSSLPGKHYDVPPDSEIRTAFNDWEKASNDEIRKMIFVNFIRDKVRLNKIDSVTMFTGIAAPPAAMAAKRAAETVPQIKMIKNVPDVLFVPGMTVAALFFVKMSKSMAMAKIAT
ncbi:calcium ion-binding protein [Parasponia andersonii]|uniref:Calcium ion-binding protein n=1 Tax=Parasponia andersonii TaxID=3476 RepID=A0A2P5CII7_PARAD|nr:calcium ion-binding protein [Parasponia andersonii]